MGKKKKPAAAAPAVPDAVGEEVSKQAPKAADGDWNALQLQAAKAFAAGRLQEALRLFCNALELVPLDERARRAKLLVYCAQICTKLGNRGDASRALGSAVELDPGALLGSAALDTAKALRWFQSEDFLKVLECLSHRPVQQPVVVVHAGGQGDCTDMEDALLLLPQRQQKPGPVQGTIALLSRAHIAPCLIRGGDLDVIGVGPEAVLDATGTVFGGASQIRLDHVTVTSTAPCGLAFGEDSSGLIRNCKVVVNSPNGICVGCNDRSVVQISSSHISGSSSHGIQAEKDTEVTCEDLTIYDVTGDGVHVCDNARVSLSRCCIREVGRMGMFALNRARISATDCKVFSTASDGVCATNMAEVKLTGCRLSHTGLACVKDWCPRAAVQVGGPYGRVVLHNCTISDNFSTGLHGQDAGRLRVTDTSVTDCGLLEDGPECATLTFRNLSSAEFTNCTLHPVQGILVSVLCNGSGCVRFDNCCLQGAVLATEGDREPEGDIQDLSVIHCMNDPDVGRLDPRLIAHVRPPPGREQAPPAKQGRSCGLCALTEEEVRQQGRKFLVCGRCKLAHYCSADCQAKHWKTHKPACSQAAASQEAFVCLPMSQSFSPQPASPAPAGDNASVTAPA